MPTGIVTPETEMEGSGSHSILGKEVPEGVILYRIEGPRLEQGDTETLLRSIAPSDAFQEGMRNGITAFEHRHGEATFFRILAFREDGSLRLELRRVL